jgi:hypothetical protein
MTKTEMIVLALIVIALVVAIALYVRAHHTQRLRDRFGAEYDRAVESKGAQREAEAALAERDKRVRGYGLKALSAAERDRYGGEWRRIQAMFVDSPNEATLEADILLAKVMSARGYPENADFDQRLEDLSVDHADSVQNYREAQETALRHARGDASTEDMRRSMIHYRALLDELMGPTEAAPPLKAAS